MEQEILNEAESIVLSYDSGNGIHYSPNPYGISPYVSAGSSTDPRGIVGPIGPIGMIGPPGKPEVVKELPSVILRQDLKEAALILSTHFPRKLGLYLEITYGDIEVTASIACKYDYIKKTLISLCEPCLSLDDESLSEGIVEKLRAAIICYGLAAQIRQTFNIEDQSI